MRIISFLEIVSGSLIFAFGLNYFIIANGLAEGGFTGIALIIHYLANWPVGIVLFSLNIPLLIIGWKLWGTPFFLKTLLGIVTTSAAVDLTQGIGQKTPDLLLAALYGGILSGIGIGLVLKAGATTGGTDILARFFHEKTGLSMGRFFFIFDFFVLSLVAIIFGLQTSLYTLVAVYVFSKIVDRVIEGFDQSKGVIVISESIPQIKEAVFNELDRGATILKGYGAYTGEEKEMLYIVLGRHQLLFLKKLISRIDPAAFVIVNDVHEVLGEGFRFPF